MAKLKQVPDSTKIQLHQSLEAKLQILRERYQRENTSNSESASTDGKTNREFTASDYIRLSLIKLI